MKKILYYIIDAFARRDLDFILKKRPDGGFAKLIKSGGVKTLNSIFPAETMPAHTSLITGAPPAEHGLSANVFRFEDLFITMELGFGFIPKVNMYKYFTLLNNHVLMKHVKTIYEVAAEKGLKTANFQEFIFRGVQKNHPGLFTSRFGWIFSYIRLIDFFFMKAMIKGSEYAHFNQANIFLRGIEAILNGFDFVTVYISWTDYLVHYYGEAGVRESLLVIDKVIDKGIKKINFDDVAVIVTADHGYSFADKHLDIHKYMLKRGIPCEDTDFYGYKRINKKKCYVTTCIGHFAQIFLNDYPIEKILPIVEEIPHNVLLVKDGVKMKIVDGDIDRALIESWVNEKTINRVGDIVLVSNRDLMYGRKHGFYHSSHYPEDREVAFISSDHEILQHVQNYSLISEIPKSIARFFS